MNYDDSELQIVERNYAIYITEVWRIMRHMTLFPIPTEKITSLKNTNVYNVIISALTSKRSKIKK